MERALKSSGAHRTTAHPLAAWKQITRAYGWALLALAPLVILYWSIPTPPFYETHQETINILGPFYFMGILLILALRALQASPAALWTGAVWFPVQSAVFFGLGPLIEVFGNDAARNALSAWSLSVDPVELVRANKLSVTGITLVLLGFWIYMKWRRPPWRGDRGGSAPSSSLLPTAVMMIIAGGALKYLVVNPGLWAATPTIFPGFFERLTTLLDVGFSVLAYQASRGSRPGRLIFLFIWPIHLFLCILSFSKTEIISAMIFPLIGAYIAHHNRQRLLVVGVVIIALSYPIAQPLIAYGRARVEERSGTINNAGYVERGEILTSYLTGSRDIRLTAQTGDDDQGWWTRLDYAGVEARAMELYDSGQANPSLHTLWMRFIPRVFWPDKPNLSLVGVDFYRLVSGNRQGQSFLGISNYGDLYWQYGWAGILIGCPLIGLLFALMAAQSMAAIQRREFLMMPAILVALDMCMLGPTDFVANSVIGGSVTYFAYIFLLRFITRELRRSRINSGLLLRSWAEHPPFVPRGSREALQSGPAKQDRPYRDATLNHPRRPSD